MLSENLANCNPAAKSIKRTNRPLVLVSVMLAMFMAAVEATIVATAMPSIVVDLGGFSLFSWVFSAFLLMQAVSIPIYGKIADMYGRKPVFAVGVIIFLIGITLAGFAQSMKVLIFFRFIQGIGSGAIIPIAMTIVGDIYSVEERARVQGYLASVWGVSSIVGPVLGGFFIQYLHWAWVFWINVPIGLMAVLGIWIFLHEQVEQKKHKIDYLGAVLLLVSVSALMIILIKGGVTWSWASTPILLLLGVFLIGAICFFIQEKKAEEPMMPLGIWKHRLIAIANIASLVSGAVMIGITTFLPTYVQGIMGKPPITAGFTLAMMSIGWPLASTFAGKLMLKFGYRAIAIVGGLFLLLGSVFFVTLQPEKGPIWAGIGSFFIGVGMGLSMTTFIVAIQSSVDWKTRGVATASNMFVRILGNTIGVALLGGILNSRLNIFINSQQVRLDFPLNIETANLLLDPVGRANLPEAVLQTLTKGLTLSLHSVYWGVLALAAITFFVVMFLPEEDKVELH